MHESVAAVAWDVAAMAWERAKGRGVDDYVGRGGRRVLDLFFIISRQFVGDTLLVVVERVLPAGRSRCELWCACRVGGAVASMARESTNHARVGDARATRASRGCRVRLCVAAAALSARSTALQ